MTKKTATKTTKQPYRKPQLEQVQLVPEEAVLAACKNSATPGKNDIACRPGTSACKSIWEGS